jgi:CheY-like chemotaxis protein
VSVLEGTMGRVLLVEDDAEIREVLAEILRGEGYEVAEVATAEDGLEQLRVGKFQLVLTDFQLPGRNGTWLIREAAAAGLMVDTASLMITAHPSPERLDGLQVMFKPLDIDELFHAMSALLVTSRAAETRALQHRREKEAGASASAVELVIYVTPGSAASLAAIGKLEEMLQGYDEGEVRLEIRDVTLARAAALEDGVEVIPSILRKRPPSRVRVSGDDLEPVEKLLEEAGAKRRSGEHLKQGNGQ